jgi:hypothetical protein
LDPLAHVPGHVVSAERSQAFKGANRRLLFLTRESLFD